MRKGGALAFVVAFILLATPAAHAAGWPQAGFDASRTNHNPRETVLGPDTIRGARRLWTYVSPAAGSTSEFVMSAHPVVTHGVVVLQSARCADASCRILRQTPLLAFDARTGTRRWSIGGLDVVERGRPRGFLAVNDGDLLVASTSGFGYDVVAFGLDSRQLRWRFSDDRCGSIPTVSHRSVYVESGGITCVDDDRDGNLDRIFGAPLKEAGLPAVHAGQLFVAGVQSQGDAYDTLTGGHVWHSDRVGGQDLMVAGSSVVYRMVNGLDVHRARDGATRYTISFPTEPTAPDVEASLPAFAENTLVELWSNGVVQSFDRSGRLGWTTALPAPSDGPFTAPVQPVIANGVVYVATSRPSPSIVAVRLSDGRILRTFSTGGAEMQSMMVANGELFGVATDRLIAWGLSSDSPIP